MNEFHATHDTLGYVRALHDDVANQLKLYLNANNLTRQEFARRAGISNATVSEVLNHINHPGLVTIARIAAAMRLEPVLLFIESKR